MKLTQGFSLIEVIVAITLIGVVGVVSVAIFTQSLRTSVQTETLSNLKQNGELATAAMSGTIRNAEAIVCYGPADSIYDRVVLRTREGTYTKFRFVDPVPPTPPGDITANGYIARQTNLDPAQLDSFCTSEPNTSQEVSLSNKDLDSGVSISNGEFIRLSGNISKDTITIKFNVNPTKSHGGNGESQTAAIQTTIQVR